MDGSGVYLRHDAAPGCRHPDRLLERGLGLAQEADPLAGANALLAQGRYSESIAELEKAWEAAAGAPEGEPLRFAILTRLTTALTLTERWEDAEARVQAAIDWRDRFDRENRGSEAALLTDLATILEGKGDNARAIVVVERVLSIHTRAQQRLAMTGDYVRLGRLRTNSEEFDQALSAYRSAAHFAESALEPGDPALAVYPDFEGAAYVQLRDYAGAEATLRRALVIRERAYGRSHANLIANRRRAGLCVVRAKEVGGGGGDVPAAGGAMGVKRGAGASDGGAVDGQAGAAVPGAGPS